MLIKKRLSWILFLIAVILSSCGPMLNIDQGELADTSWQLISVNDGKLIAGSEMTMRFSSNEIRGNASCNQYFGSYQLNGEKILISELAWTEMACLDPVGIMEQEQTLMGVLSRAAQFSIQENELRITSDSGELLVFERIYPED